MKFLSFIFAVLLLTSCHKKGDPHEFTVMFKTGNVPSGTVTEYSINGKAYTYDNNTFTHTKTETVTIKENEEFDLWMKEPGVMCRITMTAKDGYYSKEVESDGEVRIEGRLPKK